VSWVPDRVRPKVQALGCDPGGADTSTPGLGFQRKKKKWPQKGGGVESWGPAVGGD